MYLHFKIDSFTPTSHTLQGHQKVHVLGWKPKQNYVLCTHNGVFRVTEFFKLRIKANTENQKDYLRMNNGLTFTFWSSSGPATVI